MPTVQQLRRRGDDVAADSTHIYCVRQTASGVAERLAISLLKPKMTPVARCHGGWNRTRICSMLVEQCSEGGDAVVLDDAGVVWVAVAVDHQMPRLGEID